MALDVAEIMTRAGLAAGDPVTYGTLKGGPSHRVLRVEAGGPTTGATSASSTSSSPAGTTPPSSSVTSPPRATTNPTRSRPWTPWFAIHHGLLSGKAADATFDYEAEAADTWAQALRDLTGPGLGRVIDRAAHRRAASPVPPPPSRRH